jgi:hypothetical protein
MGHVSLPPAGAEDKPVVLIFYAILSMMEEFTLEEGKC